MSQNPGLRERKKLQTVRTLRATAMSLFTERGFDNVSVTQIADAAGVSKMTVFNYFPTKEDLVFGPLEEHVDEPARLIREALAEGTGLRALHEFVRARISGHDPIVGMSDNPQVLAVHRLVADTPALTRRAGRFATRSEELVADELRARASDMTARIGAAQIVGALRALRLRNLERLAAGEKPAEVEAGALADADLAFAILDGGLGAHLGSAA